MTPARRRAIVDALWAPGARAGSVWAVLDGARDPAVWAALVDARLDVRCLFAGPLPREVERAAPQLVELLPDHRLTQRLIDEGWGRAWGIFLRIGDPSNLRHQLRRQLRVRDDTGRALLLRWYDPRVLVDFLEVCDAEQRHQFFGEVDRFFAEDAGGTALRECRLESGGLRVRSIALPE
jgi:hypothetical protein